MALLGIDLGATKLSSAILSNDGKLIHWENAFLDNRGGSEVGKLITGQIQELLDIARVKGEKVKSIGISVPGISNSGTGTVWAPNIPGWTDYPLLSEVKKSAGEIPVAVDSDRACCILGEAWKGTARGCRDAIFLAVGTGIGAGIIINGEVLRGSHDVAGAIGWMALNRPFTNSYIECGCFEYHASGEGIAKVTRELLKSEKDYDGILRMKKSEDISAHEIFDAYETGDPVARRAVGQAVGYWGMAVANLVSLFNPEKIIFGGGVFGPAASLIPAIMEEAGKWSQPVGIRQVRLELSILGQYAGVYGAAFLALKNLNRI